MLSNRIDRLQAEQEEQLQMDGLFNDFYTVMKGEMDKNLNPKRILIGYTLRNRDRRTKKPWWSEELMQRWNEICIEEKKWLRAQGRDKKEHRHVFQAKRKLFDRSVQKAKRQYWRQLQNELIDSCEDVDIDFWKKMGRLGIEFERKRNIPFKIVKKDGSLSNNLKDILDKWKKYFSDLLNQQDAESVDNNEIRIQSNIADSENYINNCISLYEVRQAARKLKKGKSTGYDEILADVLCFEPCVNFLHKSFQLCFEKNIVPSQWGIGIINPIQKQSCTDNRDPAGYRGITLISAVYKLYCSILNERLNKWVEENEKLSDCLNGFRKTEAPLTIYRRSQVLLKHGNYTRNLRSHVL